MALPLPKVIPDTGPGGGLVTAMGGINSLQNDMMLRKINEVKAQYAPLTTQADAASKLAYANLMGPQFLAKLMQNPGFLGNTPDQKLQELRDFVTRAGAGQGTGNALMGTGQGGGQSMPQQQVGGNPFSMPSPKQNFSLSGWLGDKIKNIFSGSDQSGSAPQPAQPGQNALNYANQPGLSAQDRQGINALQPTIQGDDSNGPQVNLGGGLTGNLVPEAGTGYTPEMAANNQVPHPNTYAGNTGEFEGTVAQGKKLGELRADSIADLGKQQLDLSNSGVILDRLVDITQNPEFQQMRNQIPYFQDKQLWYLSKNGTPQQQKMIGDLISTAQAFKASTVNSFKGKALEKEFNLADKIKIDENDTMGVIQGKLSSLKTLKDIAESKNDIILGLMNDNKMNLGEATKRANKMVDTKGIEKQVDSILNPQPTENDIQYMMQKRNIPRAEIVKQLQAKGYKNVS